MATRKDKDPEHKLAQDVPNRTERRKPGDSPARERIDDQFDENTRSAPERRGDDRD